MRQWSGGPSHLSSVTFDSSDQALVEGFAWAKAQALAYVFTGDPVGDWYEAALPGRQAFCMRDVAHQSTGAQVLGLGHITRNMLRRFAASISETRDWCAYWEIDRRGYPCSADYRDDEHFWYCLPANFDVLDCCWREYLWAGDRAYLDDPAFRYFYTKSVHEYVYRWDQDGDGLMEHRPEYGSRGIASYNEEVPHPLVAGDQVAAQYAGYLAFANFAEQDGNELMATTARARAAELKAAYNQGWWCEEAGRFYSYLLQDRTFCPEYHGSANFLPLYFGLVEDERRAALALQDVIAHGRRNVEERSYLPGLYYQYGRVEDAYAELRAQIDPGYARREYPEVSFAVIGNLAAGMMGLAPDARERAVVTCPALAQQTTWAELAHAPALDNLISVRHEENRATTLVNLAGPAFYWKATFPGRVEEIVVDGRPWPALAASDAHGRQISWVAVRVGPQESHRAELKESRG